MDAGEDAGLDKSAAVSISPVDAALDILAPVLVHLAYGWRHRRPLDLRRPVRFTELVQRRKLVDRDPRMPHLVDKVAVKAFVRDRIGANWVTPTLWHGSELPQEAPWQRPFVVKSRHGCNQRRFVRDGGDDWSQVRTAAERWMRGRYGAWLAEWAYAEVPRRLLVEPFVGPAGVLPIDYKFYVFHGRVAAVQVHLDRETAHRWMLLDPQWRLLSRAIRTPPRPRAIDAMIEAAEQLAAGFDFVRVDLYDAEPHPRFGEMTFYPGSGLDPFDGPRIDEWLRTLWRGTTR